MHLSKSIHSFLFFLFVIVSSNYKAQDTIKENFVLLDSIYPESSEQKTYRLYTENKWNELIKEGSCQLKQGIDYFYLRMRIGIAYYEKKNYNLAEVHFKEALKFNSSDELALEYLYYCYYFVGKYEEARSLSLKFSENLSRKIGTDKKSSLGFINFEIGTKKSDSTNYYNTSTKSNYNYFDPPIYFQAGLKHYVKNKFSLFHALTYFNQKNYYASVSQTQYFIKATVPFKQNFQISPSFHVIGQKLTTETTSTTIDTLWPPGWPQHVPPPPGAPPFPTNSKTKTTSSKTNSTYYVGSIAIQKAYKKFTFGIGTILSNMNNVTQYNHNGFISYAPFGNSKIVLGCAGYFHTSDYYKTINNSVAPFMYFQPINKFSIKLSYLNNAGHNIIEDNGYIVNNSIDLTTSRFSVLANFTATKNVSVYALYQLENKEEFYQHFNYKYNVFLLGIKITP